MISAIISGQSSKFAVQDNSQYCLYDIDDASTPIKVSHSDLRMVFSGCSDLRDISVNSIEEASIEASNLVDADIALRYFLILISTQHQKKKCIFEVAESLNELLVNPFVCQMVRNNLFCHELPHDLARQSVREISLNFERVDGLFDEIVSYQAEIRKVRQSFDDVPDDQFESESHRVLFKEEAIRSGCFYKLAVESVNEALFDLYTILNKVQNSRNIIQAWTKNFEIVHAAKDFVVQKPAETTTQREGDTYRAGPGGRQAFENAKKQQRAILDKIVVGDVDRARKFAADLVASQTLSSEPEHVAMSLCQLSQFAKQYRMYELELEWAQKAINFNPSDGRTHSQVADALIRLHKFTEASEALDKAKAFGQDHYALTGRARIQRATGNLEAAAELFSESLAKFAADSTRVHDLAGLAEIARDKGNLKLAIEKYKEVVGIAPHDPVFLNGLAATYAQNGDFDEALKVYQTSLSFGGDIVVALNGIAAVNKTMGNVDLAEQQLLDIIQKFSHDPISRSALGDLYKLGGRYEEAHLILEKACNDLPYSEAPLISLANNYAEWGRHAAAQETYSKGIERFPFDPYFLTGLATSFRKSGKYQSALQAFDQARQRFPNNHYARLGRADMLRRLGQVSDALASYRRMHKEDESFLPARNGLASLLVHQGEYSEALSLLSDDEPRTQDEWRSQIIRGMLFVKQGDLEVAEKYFLNKIRKSPFARERRIMNAALASIDIERNNFYKALRRSEGVDGEVTEMIKMHALAGAKKTESARVILGNFRKNLPDFFPEIREEIASQFGMNSDRPSHDRNWLVAEEQTILLLEAA